MVINSEELEVYLKGEFAGKIFSMDKFMPALVAMKNKGQFTKTMIEFLYNKTVVYYNSKTDVVLSLDLNGESDHLVIDVIKSQAQNWIEVQDLCAKLSEVMPLEKIEITNRFEIKNLEETEAA